MRRLLVVIAIVGCAVPMAAVASAAQWTSPADTIASAATLGTDPVSVVDRFGVTTLAWVEPLPAPQSGTRIWVSRTTASGWSAPVAVSTSSEVFASRPRLAVEPDGDVRLVWQQTSTNVYFKHKYVLARTFARAAGAWGDEQEIAADGVDSFDPQPEVAVGADGVAYVAYRRSANGTSTPMVAQSTGAGWSAPTALASTATADLRIGVPSSGTPAVAWLDGNNIKASHWTGTAWATPTSTAAGEGTASSLDVATAAGRLSAVWTASSQFCFGFGSPFFSCSTVSKIWTSRYVIGTGWETAQIAGNDTKDSQGTVATTPSGDDVIAWLQLAVPNANLKVRTRSAAGVLGTVQEVSNNSAGNNLVAVDVDPAGATTIAWQRGQTAPFTPTVTRFEGGQWTQTTFATASQMFTPVLASGGSATAPVTTVAWVADPPSNGTRTLYASRLVGPAAPPKDVALAITSSPSAAVAFAAPESDGGAAITEYRATCTSSDGGATRTGTGTASPLIVAGLDVERTYTCTVAARNAEGWSSESMASDATVVPTPAATPSDDGAGTTGPAATPAAATAGSGPTASSGPRAADGFRLTGAPQAPRGGAAGRVETAITVGGPGTITQSGTVARRGRSGSVPACRGARTVRKAGRYVVTCRLSRVARAALLQSPLRLVVVTTFRGTDGSTATTSATVRLAQTRLPDPTATTRPSSVTG